MEVSDPHKITQYSQSRASCSALAMHECPDSVHAAINVAQTLYGHYYAVLCGTWYVLHRYAYPTSSFPMHLPEGYSLFLIPCDVSVLAPLILSFIQLIESKSALYVISARWREERRTDRVCRRDYEVSRMRTRRSAMMLPATPLHAPLSSPLQAPALCCLILPTGPGSPGGTLTLRQKLRMTSATGSP